MNNRPPLWEAIDNLVKIVANTTASPQDKTDAYLAIKQYFQSDFQSAEHHLQNYASRLIGLSKMHMTSGHLNNQDDLTLAALHVLGLCLSSNRFARIPKESVLSGILSDVCAILQAPKDKLFYVRSFWLLANQHIHNHILAKHVAAIMSCFHKHTSDTNCRRTVVTQAILTIKRLCSTCPNEMEGEMNKCMDVIFAELVSSPESLSSTTDVLKACIPILARNPVIWKNYATKKLNEGLGKKVGQYFKQSNKLAAICFWTSMVNLLGADLFLLEKDTKTCWTNVVLNSFKSCRDEVVSAAYDMWIAIVDAFIRNPDEGQATTRQVNIIMEPLKTRYRHHQTPAVAEKCLRTYWYLICKIGGNLDDYINKVVVPVLQELFSILPAKSNSENLPTSRQSTSIKPDLTSRSQAPVRSAKGTIPLLTSPSHSPPLRVLAVEMLCVLLSTPSERKSIKEPKLDPFVGPKISSEHIIKNAAFFSKVLLEATRSCLLINEQLVIQCWIFFVREVMASPHVEGDPEIWCCVFSVLRTIVDEELGSVNFILKVADVIPYGVSLSNLKSDENPNGHAALFIIQALLHPHYITLEAYENEKFFIKYQLMIEVLFNGVSGQLQSADIIFSSLISANSFMDGRTSWRLWSTLTHVINGYVSISNEVNKGTVMKHDFSIAMKSLVYPLEFIDLSKLKEGEKNNLVDRWNESYETFNRAISLLPGIKNNTLLDEFCRSMIRYCETDTCKSIDIIVRLMWVVIKSAVFDFASFASTCGSPVAEVDELGALKHFLTCVMLLLKPMLENREQASRNSDKHLFELIEMIQYFIAQLNSYPQLYCTMQILSSLSPLLFGKFSASQSKLFTYVEKLTDSICSAFKNACNVEYDVKLMNLFEPLIISAISSKRRETRVRAVRFWNETFGMNNSLICSNSLKDVLMHSKTPVKAMIEGVAGTRVATPVNNFDETTQFPDASQSQSQEQSGVISPVKMMGSFLPKHLSDDLKIYPRKSTLMHTETRSPVSTPISGKKSYKSGRRKLPIDLVEDDFVEIKEGPKKAHLLTEHQMEMRREKKLIPVMYNNLDQQSQDTSLFSSLLQNSNSQSTQIIESGNVLEERGVSDSSDNVHFEKDLPPINIQLNRNELLETDKEPGVLATDQSNVIPSVDQEGETERVESTSPQIQDIVTAAAPNKALVEASPCEEDDFIPSSQTQQTFSQVHSPSVDPELSRGKIVESSCEKLAQISTLQVVVNDIQTEDFVEGNKENELSNSHIARTESISTTGSTHPERSNIRTKNSIGWLSTESTSTSKPARLSTSLPKENKKSDDNVRLGAPKKMTIKRKRKSQISKNIQRKKTCSLPFKEEIIELDDHTVEKDAFAVCKAVMRHQDTALFVENAKELYHVDTKSIQGCSKEIQAQENIFVAEFNDSCKEQELVGLSDSLANASNQKEISCSKVERGEDVQMQWSKSGADSNSRLHPNEAEITGTTSKGAVPESPKCSLNAEIKDLDNNHKNDETVPGDAVEKTKVTVSISSTELRLICTSTHKVSHEPIASISYASVPQSSACASPITKIHSAASFAKTTVHNSPQGLSCIPSPLASPASILKKRSMCQSPSPPSKNRRVSFQLPEGKMLLKDGGSEVAQEKDKFTGVCNRMNRQTLKKSDASSIYPDLIECTIPIEKILPSIQLSRCVGQLVRAQNILTIGDLSSLSESQVENLPIRSPKLRTVKNALKAYSAKLTPKSPLSMTDFSSSPHKDGGAEAAAVLMTPSKHGDLIKPTSLFNTDANAVKEEVKSPLQGLPQGEPENPVISRNEEVKNPLLAEEEKLGGTIAFPASESTLDDKRHLLVESDLVDEVLDGGICSEHKLDTSTEAVTIAAPPNPTTKAVTDFDPCIDHLIVEKNKVIDVSCEGVKSVDGEEEDVLYSTPTNETEGEMIMKADLIERDMHSKSVNQGDNREITFFSDKKAGQKTGDLLDLSGLREDKQVGHSAVKMLEVASSLANDSFESVFAAGDISPIKNNYESSFFETSSIDVSDKDEKGRAKDAFFKGDNRHALILVDEPSIEGITPLANRSDLNQTSLDEDGVELSTSVVCVPSSITSLSTSDESTSKASLTENAAMSTAQGADVVVIPTICSSVDRETIASITSSSALCTNTTASPSTNTQSTHIGILPHIDTSNLTTHDIFELVSEIENLKSEVMAELKSRMLGHHGKTCNR